MVPGRAFALRLLDETIEVDKLRERVTAHPVGRVLGREFELPREGRDGVGIRYRLEERRFEQLCRKLDPPPVRSAQSTQVHPDAPEDAPCGDQEGMYRAE